MTRSVKEWMEDTREFPRHLPDDPEVPYLSPSQIKKLLTCGAQYRYKYVDGRPDPMGPKAWFGIACHDGLCEGFEDWIDTGLPPSPDRVADAAEDKLWDFLTELGPDKVKGFEDRPWTEIHEQCQQVRTISKLLLRWFKENDWTPLAAEVEVSKRFRDFATYGYADMVAADKHDRVWVLDFKTTGSTPAGGVARRKDAFQIITYGSAIEDQGIDGVDLPSPVHACGVVYAVRNKTPKVAFCPVPFHEGSRRFAEKIAHSAGDQIQFGELSPNPVSAGFLCHPDRCTWWDECPGAPKHEDENVDSEGIEKEAY